MMNGHIETISSNIIVLLLLPVAILFVLAVHEMGHYFAAKLVRMRVEQVSFGFGRKLWEKTDKNGTHWIVNLLPLKAHVHIADYNPQHNDPLWQRLVVVLAGPVSNFVLPLILFSAFFILFGKPVIPTIVTGVEIGMPSYEAGIRPGDEIRAINGTPIHSLQQITAFTRPKRDTPLLFTYKSGDQILETPVMPVWIEYQDTDGMDRARGRVGLMTWQLPYALALVKTVAGEKADNEDIARDLLIRHLGQRITLDLEANDRDIHEYLIDLDKDANAQLLNPDDKDYDSFVLGTLRDNRYLPLDIRTSLTTAAKQTTEMMGNVIKLPFNLFPIDPEWLSPDAVVSHRTSAFKRNIYMLIYLTSLCSVFIGFLNLIPVPGLDGCVILLNAADAIAGKTLSNKSRAMLIAGALLILYGTAFLANAPDIQGYFEFKIEDLKDGKNS